MKKTINEILREMLGSHDARGKYWDTDLEIVDGKFAVIHEDRFNKAEDEIEKEFQRRLTERVNSERIEKIIYNWVMQNFDFKTLNSMNEHDKRRSLSEFIAREIRGDLIDYAEAEIEKEISARKEDWKMKLLELIEHCDKIYSSVNGEEDLIKKTQIKKLIEEI